MSATVTRLQAPPQSGCGTRDAVHRPGPVRAHTESICLTNPWRNVEGD
jgi:hypothetical protein